MTSSSSKCTPRSRNLNSPNVINTPVTDRISASICKSSGKINKTLLTPCRRVGLKRKSTDLPKQQLFKTLEIDCEESNDTVCSVKRISVIKESTSSNSKICDENCWTQFKSNENVQSMPKESQSNSQIRVSSPSKSNQSIWEVNHKVCSSVTIDDCNNLTLQMLDTVAENIKKKKDRLKHFQLSKVYDKKHDLQMLQKLTEKWKDGCQNALLELKSLFNERGYGLSMSQLLSQFKISHDLINFNEECDDFE